MANRTASVRSSSPTTRTSASRHSAAQVRRCSATRWSTPAPTARRRAARADVSALMGPGPTRRTTMRSSRAGTAPGRWTSWWPTAAIAVGPDRVVHQPPVAPPPPSTSTWSASSGAWTQSPPSPRTGPHSRSTWVPGRASDAKRTLCIGVPSVTDRQSIPVRQSNHRVPAAGTGSRSTRVHPGPGSPTGAEPVVHAPLTRTRSSASGPPSSGVPRVPTRPSATVASDSSTRARAVPAHGSGTTHVGSRSRDGTASSWWCRCSSASRSSTSWGPVQRASRRRGKGSRSGLPSGPTATATSPGPIPCRGASRRTHRRSPGSPATIVAPATSTPDAPTATSTPSRTSAATAVARAAGSTPPTAAGLSPTAATEQPGSVPGSIHSATPHLLTAPACDRTTRGSRA